MNTQPSASSTGSPFSFGGTIPQHYDSDLGPFLLEPFAQDLVSRITRTDARDVLELACGTGRVTRHLAQRFSGTTQLLATDINPDMLATGQQLVTAPNLSWARVDMTDMPYEDDRFDLIVCQFGVMFVPDKGQTLLEIRRVLKPGGQLLFNTWGPMANNPVWQINNTVLNVLVSNAGVSLEQGPFSMQDEQVVLQLLEQAGFGNPTVSAASVVGQIESAALATQGFIQGTAASMLIQKNAPERMADIVQTLERTFAAELGDHPMYSPLQAWVFDATK